MSSMERGSNHQQNRFGLFFLWDIHTLLDEEEDDLPPLPSKSLPSPPEWLSPWFMTRLQLSFLAVFGDLAIF